MPIFPIFDNAVFGPIQTKIMGDALDHAIGLFPISPPIVTREAMANRIIEAAHRGVRELNELVDAALVGTGVTR
jgi:hypothetical protein